MPFEDIHCMRIGRAIFNFLNYLVQTKSLTCIRLLQEKRYNSIMHLHMLKLIQSSGLFNKDTGIQK